MRQFLACQSLACHFLTAFSGIFLVQKLKFKNFGGILKMFFSKLGKETIIFGQNPDFAVSIEQWSYSENDFDQKLVILTKLTKKFQNFENFENFQKMRQSLAKDCITRLGLLHGVICHFRSEPRNRKCECFRKPEVGTGR